MFITDKLSLTLTTIVNGSDNGSEQEKPVIALQRTSSANHPGDGVTAKFRLVEGQSVSFVLRDPDQSIITRHMIDEVQKETHK